MTTTTTGITINGPNNKVDIKDLAYVSGATATFNSSTDVVTVISGNYEATLVENNAGSQFEAIPDGAGGTEVVPVCFASGTRIRTRSGDVAVETLRVGDELVTATGATASVRWIGHRAITCDRHPKPCEVRPIRIAAHAFADRRPARDLLVSPGHAICVDLVGDVLIPAGVLVNGTTIVREWMETVTYWHVELQGGHGVILAENLPCESYLDTGNRGFFAEADIVALDSAPDATISSHGDLCRPYHADGPVVAFVRERLNARALALGWRLREEPLGHLHALVDGRRVEPATNGLTARFLVPADAAEVWLVSETRVPAELGVSTDSRALGVCVGGLVIDDGLGAPRVIGVDHPLLGDGFHDVEDGPQRWTAGRVRLPRDLWEGCRGSFFLRLDLAGPALPNWIAPTAAESAVGPMMRAG